MCLVNLLGGLSGSEHAQPTSESPKTAGVRGLWSMTIWPLGAGFLTGHHCSPANNWDLIWKEISKGLVTPLVHTDRICLLALKETSLFHFSFGIGLWCLGLALVLPLGVFHINMYVMVNLYQETYKLIDHAHV